MFTKEEKEFLIRLMQDVKINPLAVEAIPVISMLQGIARKVFAHPDAPSEIAEQVSEEALSDTKRKRSRKADEGSDFV